MICIHGRVGGRERGIDIRGSADEWPAGRACMSGQSGRAAPARQYQPDTEEPA